ncbi:unnamed protein product [Rhizoctonia solani]|uniref:Uncharacterized protein n=1 Tax=Rhizoctonia solani TaxID=456999 RepID=A0A8H2X6Z2_9AGAM|nr:unnamed protein product [Rhizoctonia solani]
MLKCLQSSSACPPCAGVTYYPSFPSTRMARHHPDRRGSHPTPARLPATERREENTI